MKLTGKITAAALAVSMALLTGSCTTADTSWAYELGEDRLPAGIYLNYMLDAYTEAQAEYIEANTVEGEDAPDQPKPAILFKSQKDGQAVSAWIPQRAQEFALQHFGLRDKYAELNLSVSEEDANEVAGTLNSIWDYSSAFYETNGISESSLQQYLLETKMKEQLFYALYKDGGELSVSEAELQSIFLEQYTKAEYLRVAKVTDGDDKDTKNTELKTLVDGYFTRIAAGEAIEDVDYDHRKLTAAEGQEVTKAEPGTNALILSGKDLQYYGKLGEGVAQVTADAPLLIESDTEFYILRKLDLSENPEDISDYRQSLLGELKYEEFLVKLQEWGTAKNPTSNTQALSRYTSSKLEVEYSKYV